MRFLEVRGPRLNVIRRAPRGAPLLFARGAFEAASRHPSSVTLRVGGHAAGDDIGQAIAIWESDDGWLWSIFGLRDDRALQAGMLFDHAIGRQCSPSIVPTRSTHHSHEWHRRVAEADLSHFAIDDGSGGVLGGECAIVACWGTPLLTGGSSTLSRRREAVARLHPGHGRAAAGALRTGVSRQTRRFYDRRHGGCVH